MRRILLIYISIQLLTYSCAVAERKSSKFELYKSWIVYKYKAGPITAITLEQADSLINKKILLKPTSIYGFGNDKCDNYKLEEQNINIEDYLSTFNINSKALDLNFTESKLFSLIGIDNQGEVLDFEFIKNNNELIYVYEGFFFYLK